MIKLFKMVRSISLLYFAALLFSCVNRNQPADHHSESQEFPTTGSIEILDTALNNLVPVNAKLEIISEGFNWSEGPLWIPSEETLLFSDVPENKVYQWTEKSGLERYLEPSGYTGQQERGGEMGSNGLLLDAEGNLVICQHGDRRIAMMNAPLDNPQPEFLTLTDHYEGKKFNSPNDAVYHSNGDLYFTDPPYGLEGKMNDPAKETPFQGVYRLSKDGGLQLLTSELSRPNGIALSPDEKTLYVANSDRKNPVWMAWDINKNGGIANGRVFFDATTLLGSGKGLPDGFKVHKSGTLFASGPGGILIISRKGHHLGTIKTGQATSNCAFNEDESILYITADMYLMRINLIQ